MVDTLIKTVLDNMNLINYQDTPTREIDSNENDMYIYTAGDIIDSVGTMGSNMLFNQQVFKIYLVSSDLYYANSQDTLMARNLMLVYNSIKNSLPTQINDVAGKYYITDCISPEVKFMGINDKTLRQAELSFTVLWGYDYGNIQ